MQRVKPNAAAIRIINWISQQMVYIYYQSAHQQAKSVKPFFQIKNACHQKGGENVKDDMNQGIELIVKNFKEGEHIKNP